MHKAKINGRINHSWEFTWYST